ncbi:hypothetical protein B0T21DRAFT_407944 [Apiosordaria backusii]|uniref:Uncharacterized protein n=1 Tax=Apiosordaria backusii TaxID=314023 RepID=A0AA40K3T0_9PEZI|nr:hypothetical protein B0T21DRAFT_407944 [Apiosordaria backusii]
MNSTDTAQLPPSSQTDQPALYEKPEYNIQLVLDQGSRRILISFPSDVEAKSYFDCIQFTNRAVKRGSQVYLDLTEASHVTLKGRLGIVFNKRAHASEWLLRTRLERCFRQKQKTLWLKDVVGLRGVNWSEMEGEGAGSSEEKTGWSGSLKGLKRWSKAIV